MKTALLTGFQAFGKYVINPTETLARALDGEIIAGHRIYSRVFPMHILSPESLVDFGREIVNKAREINASVIVSLGMASGSKGARIETQAVNWIESDYCTAFENHKPIYSDYPIHSVKRVSLEQWDIETLAYRLAAIGIKLEISENAGRYSCNALMFRILRAFEELNQTIPFLFVHVPCTEEAVAQVQDFERSRKVLIVQEKLPTLIREVLSSYP